VSQILDEGGLRPPLLVLKDVRKSFGAVDVLKGVSLQLVPGTVTALVGDNGAGKSTLIKAIAGIYSIDAGEMVWEGSQVHLKSPNDATALGIEIVYQDLALCDNLDIVANMFLGREQTRGLTLNEDAMEARAEEVLASLSVTTVKSVRQPVASLSGGQRQSVAVARAVMWNSKLVILDEPTAALGVAQTRQVLALIRRLADKGLAVMFVSHNLVDVFEVADRIAVLRLGQMVGDYDVRAVDSREVVELMTTGRSNAREAS
jgi:ABC-type sugar transport system ATPase subunit